MIFDFFFFFPLLAVVRSISTHIKKPLLHLSRLRLLPNLVVGFFTQQEPFSSSLNLEMDSPKNPSFLLEVLPYIGVVQLFVDLPHAARPSLILSETTVKIIANDNNVCFEFPLPCTVKPDSATLTRIDNSYLCIRISLTSRRGETSDQDEEHLPSPSLADFQGLCCRYVTQYISCQLFS